MTATALCIKMGLQDCKELREGKDVRWEGDPWKVLSVTDLMTLATLGSVLPALEMLILEESSGSAGPDGVWGLAEGLGAGALPAVIYLHISGMQISDAGASALAAALDRRALPRLKLLVLTSAAINDAALVALAPALRRRPALEYIYLTCNPFGDEGLAALVAPPPPAGAPPPPAAGLAKLKELDLCSTKVTDAGCATLASALEGGALPELKTLNLKSTPASAAAIAFVDRALATAWKRRREYAALRQEDIMEEE